MIKPIVPVSNVTVLDGPKVIKVASGTTSDDYESLVKFVVVSRTAKVLVQLVEAGSADIKYKVLGSVDDQDYITLCTDITLNNGESTYEVFSDPWMFFDVQCKSASGGTGVVSVKVVRGG